jgi:hypothetical protein
MLVHEPLCLQDALSPPAAPLHEAAPLHDPPPALQDALSPAAGVVGSVFAVVEEQPAAPNTAPVNAAAINLFVKLMISVPFVATQGAARRRSLRPRAPRGARP